MRRYAALLRGINISGKNKIVMPKLKETLSQLGFENAATYLASGNAVFSSGESDAPILADMIRSAVRDRFGLDVPVLVIPQEELREALSHAPDWWASGEKKIYDNLIFMIPPLTYGEFCEEIGSLKDGLEKAHNYKNVIFWSFVRKDYQKTNWWSRTASAGVGEKITIRTAGTVKKLAAL